MPSQRTLFESQQTLEAFCEKIVLPNMTLRTFEEELFEDDPAEYVRRDLETAGELFGADIALWASKLTLRYEQAAKLGGRRLATSTRRSWSSSRHRSRRSSPSTSAPISR